MGSSKGVMDAPRDLRGVSRAHLMLGNSITDVVHVWIENTKVKALVENL